MKRVLWLLLVVLLLAGLALAGCAAQPTEHEPVEIAILTQPTGATSYLYSNAVADILNKNHPWIRASVLAGFSPAAATERGSERDPKTTLFTPTNLSYWDARAGNPPYTRKYELMLITAGVRANSAWAILDPSIKTMADFAGKRIHVLRAGAGMKPYIDAALKGYGVWDKMTREELDNKPAADALKDGLIDACNFTSIPVPDGELPHAYTTELVATKGDQLYFVSFDEKAHEYARKATGWKVPMGTVPPLTWGPNQTEPKTTYQNMFAMLTAFPGADEEVMYEVTRLMVVP